MKVVIAGDALKEPILFNGNQTSLLIADEIGNPVVIYQFSKNGYIRYTKGEDTNFEEIKKSLGF